MIQGKIKADDFPLFYSNEELELHGIKSDDIITLTLGYNGEPYTDKTLEEVKEMYCADFYYSNDRAQNFSDEFHQWGQMNKFNTYPMEITSFISLFETND